MLRTNALFAAQKKKCIKNSKKLLKFPIAN